VAASQQLLAMSDEDNALKALQSINREIAQILLDMREKRKDSRPYNTQDTTKLKELNDLLVNTKKQILSFMNRYDKQTSLNQFDNN
jgi:hypothetical protein